MACCKNPTVLRGDCFLCPGQYLPKQWEVVIPAMENYTATVEWPERIMPPFRQDQCSEICASNKVSGVKILKHEHSIETSCYWRYKEVWEPFCEEYPVTGLLPALHFTFKISKGHATWQGDPSKIVVELQISTCNSLDDVCTGISGVLVNYNKVFELETLGSCREYTLDFCDNHYCNFFYYDKSCVWPETLTVEAK